MHVELLPNGVQDEDDEEEMEGASHRREHSDKVVEKLKELIQTVQVCLQNNPGMQSSELTQRCKELLSTYEREYNLSICYVSVCLYVYIDDLELKFKPIVVYIHVYVYKIRSW